MWERVYGGVTDEQMRARPPGMNSLAWLLWHTARTEDVNVNLVITAGHQVFDEGWSKRLGIGRADIGTGMTDAEVTDLTRRLDLAAAKAYRNAVGKRTREIVGAFTDADWGGNIDAAVLERVAAQGAIPAPLAKVFGGRPRAAVLSGIALFHPSAHMGEAVTVRSAGGFGTGI
jgi:hypothetical protein